MEAVIRSSFIIYSEYKVQQIKKQLSYRSVFFLPHFNTSHLEYCLQCWAPLKQLRDWMESLLHMEKLKKLGLFALERERGLKGAGGADFISEYSSCPVFIKTEQDSLLWYPLKGKRQQTEIEMQEVQFKHFCCFKYNKKKRVVRWSNTDAGCPQRLGSLHPWRCSKPNWNRP